jgi:capsule polysaccharide export protein KpsE/RkpR
MHPAVGDSTNVHTALGSKLEEAMAQRRVPVLEPRSEPEVPSVGDRQPWLGGSTATLSRLQLLWDNRRMLFRVAAWGLVVFTTIAFLIPAKYDSLTQLMPPDTDTSGTAMLAAIAGKGGDALSGYASNLLGIKSSGALFIGVLRSRTVEDSLINRFDLRKVYWVRRWEDARKELEDRTSIVEDRKSGIISVRVRDRSPQRAQEMAQAYVDQLNIAVSALSTSSARREREFLETRLRAVKQDLDQAAQDFSQFASKNTAIDIAEQGKAMVGAAARLQGELIASEAQMKGLEQIYTANNARVRAAQANIDELRRQLNKLGEVDAGPGAPSGDSPLYPSIRQLPLLGVTYSDLYRRIKIQEAVYETLTKQYELAKVQEAKEIPTVKVLDVPNYPERKASPPRIFIMCLGVFISLTLGCAWILGQGMWDQTGPQDPRRLFAEQILKGAQRDGRAFHARLTALRQRVKRSPREENRGQV